MPHRPVITCNTPHSITQLMFKQTPASPHANRMHQPSHALFTAGMHVPQMSAGVRRNPTHDTTDTPAEEVFGNYRNQADGVVDEDML